MGEKATFEGWAIVELFGHQQIAGYLSEQALGGTSFVRVDVPDVDGQPGFTKFFGGSAIYAITPTTEEIATVAAQHLSIRPVSPWIVPVSRQLGPAVVDDEGECELTEEEEERGREALEF
jgi:hypothetical protein